MVRFFKSSEGYTMYAGADKYENEDLIKYGLPEDLWFHVDDLSSAHVYLRLKKNQRLEDVSDATIHECAQLVKANSIEGCKMKSVSVVYTRWRNLHKTSAMEVGAIGFHDRAKVKKIRIEKNNAIVRAIEKTEEVHFPNLAELQEIRAAEFRAEKKIERQKQLQTEKEQRAERERQKELQSYSSMMVADKMKSNTDMPASVDDSSARDYEDDFM